MAKRANSQNPTVKASSTGGGKAAQEETLKDLLGKVTEPSAYKVFISHSSKESWVARQISKELKNIGLNTWLDDTDLHGGDKIKAAIKSGIEESQEVLVIISMNSAMSQWVIYEVAIAEIWEKRITPILNNIGHDVIAPLQGIKGYDLNEFDKFLLELAERAAQPDPGTK